ncbi:MAG: MFS transporter [Sphaerochaetaceae bacterium]|jgi:predicted MFS family arabinose efflux permease
MRNTSKRVSPAVTVIIMFGVISLLGDVVYEAARGGNSQYLNLLGISASQVGLVFGLGEFLGYGIRLVSGLLIDKSKKHWLFMFIGYGMLLVVPLMGLTADWNILVVLILAERIGKALRSPAKDTILSEVADKQVGIGFAFGLQEALDQIGAFLGPLLFTLVFFLAGKNGIAQYQAGYRLLVVPYVALIVFLTFVYIRVSANRLAVPPDRRRHPQRLQPIFWMYTAFTFFCTLGFVNFSTIGYHLKAEDLLSDGNITLLYSLAMIVDAATALAVGKIYDFAKEKLSRKAGGLLLLIVLPTLSCLLPILALSRKPSLIVAGMVVFGMIMGVQETVMRSAIADVTPFDKRGTGYGVFNTSYGLALMCGAGLMGWLYDKDLIWAIIVFSVAAEVIAAVLYGRLDVMVRKANA